MQDREPEVIELGVASVETRGLLLTLNETEGLDLLGLIGIGGILDE